MIEKFQKKGIALAEVLHRRFFGHEMSDEMRKFLGNLSWSFFGGIIAAGIMFALNIIAGRWLGPEEYGKYNLVLLMAQFFSIPMILGMDISTLRKIAQTDDENKRKEFVSSSVFFIFFSILITASGIFLAREFLAEIFSTEITLIIVSMIFGFTLTLKMLFDGVIKGFYFFRFQAIIRIIEAISAVVVFFALHLIFRNYLQLTFSLVLSGLLVSVIYFFRLRKFFGRPNFESFKKLFKYAKFVVTGSIISIIVVYGDRFVINRYFGAEELGLYSAYYTATILIIGQFISIFTNVFFAMISKIREKKIMLIKIDRMLLFGVVPVTISMFLIGLIVLRLFGNAYEIDFLILFLFGFVASLQFFVSFYANMVNSHSEKTYFWGLAFFSLRALLYLIYIVILVIFGKVTIPAILMGLVLNYIIDIMNLRYIIKKYA